MRKMALTLLVAIILLNALSCSIAFAETDSTYDLVYQTVKQAYNVEIEDYDVTEQEDGELLCTFNGGYALVHCGNDEPLIKQLWCDTTKYFDNYLGGGTLTEQKYSIEYVNKNIDNKVLAIKTPNYLIAGVTCVPNAATCLLGFYDRYFDDLILNFTAGRSVASKYLYSSDDENVADAAKQLSYDMGMSNPATDGATVNDFKSGMKTYVARKNLNVSYASCMSWGRFDYDKALLNLNSNIPLIIFTRGYNLVSIQNISNEDIVTMLSSNGAHAMAVFGYSEITYSQSNGKIKVDKYLQVSSGVSSMSNALVNIETNISIDDAYAVTIK
ncbi:MAG: hypothetical protein NC485_14840 [Ruminococcus flavefaciens]|nr:hypothetical protein [Ruminococcus flavefaciens]